MVGMDGSNWFKFYWIKIFLWISLVYFIAYKLPSILLKIDQIYHNLEFQIRIYKLASLNLVDA